MTTTPGTLLDGRVRYAQSAHGYRTGIEPVLLAAAIAARPGQRVVEAGTGAGAALLCLAARLPEVHGLGLELNAEMAAIATANIAANVWEGRLRVEVADIASWAPQGRFDHACANPPWHDARATASPNTARDLAKRANPALLALWVARLALVLRPRGTMTLALPAAALASAMAACQAADLGSILVFPLWPHEGEAARLMLLQAVRGGRGPSRIAAGLALHRPGGGYTDAADAVLRGGGGLDVGEKGKARGSAPGPRWADGPDPTIG